MDAGIAAEAASSDDAGPGVDAAVDCLAGVTNAERVASEQAWPASVQVISGVPLWTVWGTEEVGYKCGFVGCFAGEALRYFDPTNGAVTDGLLQESQEDTSATDHPRLVDEDFMLSRRRVWRRSGPEPWGWQEQPPIKFGHPGIHFVGAGEGWGIVHDWLHERLLRVDPNLNVQQVGLPISGSTIVSDALVGSEEAYVLVGEAPFEEVAVRIHLMRLPHNSSVMEEVAVIGNDEVFSRESGWLALAANEAYVFTANDGGPNDPGLFAVPKQGGTPIALDDDDAGALVLHGNYLYWTTGAVAFPSGTDGTAIRRMPLDAVASGQPPESIIDCQDNPAAIAIDGDTIYWANASESGEIWRATLRDP